MAVNNRKTELKQWTNSYLIFLLTVMAIMIAMLGEHLLQLFLYNFIYALTMVMIVLRDYHKGYRVISKRTIYIIACLTIISIISSVFYHFSLFPEFQVFFLFSAGLIKVGIYGYGWLSTVKILMQKQKVTEQTIILAITSYLFIGIIWSFIYFTIWEINPHAFHISSPAADQFKAWNLVMYFSLTTLTTLGYGDIIPVDRVLMLAANFEAVAGSIYLTVIIARLVSLYSISD